MKMKSGPKMKGRQQASPGGGRSANNTGTLEVKTKGKAVAPTQGVTRNHPNTSTSTGKRAMIGKGVPNSYFANSRGEVHSGFSVKGKHD